ncbi:DNA processing protein [Candidatus Magnetomoraceae bacterium gMMP-13]
MEKIISWLGLKSVPGIGNHIFKRLIDYFKSPDNVFRAPKQELAKIEGMNQRILYNLKKYRIPQSVYKDLALARQKGFSVISMEDPDYPALLKEIPDPPPVLYVYGKLRAQSHHIAVVGSRNATKYGISSSVRLCKELSNKGLTIVSGMARGIDTAAHEGTLFARGRTIAVLGSGLDVVYPAENRGLFHRIAKNGAVISEFPMKAKPEAFHFPMRNRIISGISLGIIVVEAGKRSGSLITARMAMEQNREVFAVPGSIHSLMSTGPHNLIKNGAKLTENAQDVIEEILPAARGLFEDFSSKSRKKEPPKVRQLPPLSEDEKKVWDALKFDPVHIDILVRSLSIEAASLSGILLQLELKGLVNQAPGKLFSKI